LKSEEKVLPVDLKAHYAAHKSELDDAIHRVLDSGWYIGGEEVAAFEAEFAAFVGVAHAVATGTGTDALHLALRACGIGTGDLVATVSHTAVATVAAVELAGAVPVFVDVDPETCTMSAEALGNVISGLAGGGLERLRAVIPVHLYGHPVAMDPVLDLAREHGLRVIEDCAQAHGAELGGRRVGSLGDVACFSFYPTKNLGALGDGGILVTDNADLAERARLIREYGWRQRYVSEVPGMNTRLDPLQAAVLRVRLRHLGEENRRRRDIARHYSSSFAGTPLTLPVERTDVTHVYHQYVLRCPDRDGLRGYLQTRSIGTLIHYPVPVHLQPAYRDRVPVRKGSLTCTERICREVLSLPMHAHLSTAQQNRVTEAVLEWPGLASF
jgi:dTDP-4-amino-4,6-dideoxygalactose transaminase